MSINVRNISFPRVESLIAPSRNPFLTHCVENCHGLILDPLFVLKMKMSALNDSKQLYASYLPTKKELAKEIERERDLIEREVKEKSKIFPENNKRTGK